MPADDDDIVLSAILDRYEQIKRFIQDGLDLHAIGMSLDGLLDLQAKTRAAIVTEARRRYGAAGEAKVLERLDGMKREVVKTVNATLTHGGVRSLGAKFERLRSEVREMLDLTGHDDEVTSAMSAMDPLKREMIDWVVRRAYGRGDRAALIREVWAWYEADPERVRQHPIKLATFTTDVSRRFADKLQGRYRPLTQYRYLALPMD